MESLKCDICDKSFTGLVSFQQHEASDKHKKKMRLVNGFTFESPKQVNPDQNQLHCTVCMVFISGLDNYQKHVNSLEHAIMIQKKNNDLLSQSVSSTFELKTERNQPMESTISSTDPTGVALIYFAECKPCQKQFTGPWSYQQHLASAGHRKKCGPSYQIMLNDEINPIIKKKSIDNLPHNSQSPPSMCYVSEQNQLMGSTISSTEPIKAVASFTECKPCQKQFSGPEPYQQHLASAGHKKKCGPLCQVMPNDETDSIIKKDTIIDNLTHETQSSVSDCNLSEMVQPFARCDICQMEFNGALPYQIHLVSDDHKMKESNQLLGNSFPESLSASKCDICIMSFTGPVPYRQHLASNGHKKKMIASNFPKQLATTESLSQPEFVLKDAGHEQSSINDLQKWYCETCKMQCSGPIPYNTHVRGQIHAKKLRALKVEENEQSNMNDLQKWYCVPCKMQCSGPIPYNSHIHGQNHIKILRALELEENLRKIKELGPLPYVGNNEIGFNLSNEMTSTINLKSECRSEKEVQSVELEINDLNINVKSDGTKIFSDKFQMNMNDLIALPNLNIIPPEKLDVTVFGPDDEIVFSSPKKCKQEFPSENNLIVKQN